MSNAAAANTREVFHLAFDIPAQRVFDLIDCAHGSAGSGYWAHVVAQSEVALAAGGFIRYKAVSDGMRYTHSDGRTVFALHRNSIAKGMLVFATKFPHAFAQWMDENEDGPCGDLFLQCCLFGEEVFA